MEAIFRMQYEAMSYTILHRLHNVNSKNSSQNTTLNELCMLAEKFTRSNIIVFAEILQSVLSIIAICLTIHCFNNYKRLQVSLHKNFKVFFNCN